MLDRVKKKQFEGFKEFVLNMEVTAGSVKSQIFLTGLLEDPIYMSHVLKNIKTIDDFFHLPSDEIDLVLNHQDGMLQMLAKSIAGASEERMKAFESTIPRWFARLKEELRYLPRPSPIEQETARHFMIKIIRKLQMAEKIQGFKWKLPPEEVVTLRSYPDGRCQIYFGTGLLAAEGEMVSNQRIGFWRHYYENGKLLAEGDYREGLKNGMWVFYHSNGLHKSQGKYKADAKQGVWQEWNRDGKMIEAEYTEGVKRD